MSPRVPTGAKASRQPARIAVSVSMSSNGTTPHRAFTSFFSLRRLRGSAGVQRRQQDRALLAAVLDVHPWQVRQLIVQLASSSSPRPSCISS
ncbi:hypothetical protein ACIBLB_28000 [Streptosporangium canum]|uniref:hypothetical protein n=1 Tax=Streptosporangium canum TaxID=324952 RepID=UPI0037982D18